MNYIQIGVLGKTHGLKGELKFKIEEEYIDDFNEADVVFIKNKGHYAPYFIESIRSSSIIKFEDTEDIEAAKTLQNLPIFLKEEDITIVAAEPLEELIYQYLKGYKMMDDLLGELGDIQSVEAYPQQEIAIVNYQNKEVLIPLNEFVISDIDNDNQIVNVSLPEGLLDI
jgi:16S rRNA processing protein RimM